MPDPTPFAPTEDILGGPGLPAVPQQTSIYGDLPASAQAARGLQGAPVDKAPIPLAAPTGYDLGGGTPAPGGPPVSLQPKPAGNPTSEQDPTRGMDAFQAAKFKYANGLPMSQQDFLNLDALQPRGSVGGSTTSTTVSRLKQNDSPELRALRAEGDRLVGQSAANYEGVGDVQYKAAQMRAAELDQYAESQKAEAARMQTEQEQQQASQQKMMADQARMQQDYVKQAQDIDPNRILHGGKSILAGLAMALGAAGAVQGRSQNFAKEIIDGKLAADLDAQKTALGAKRDQMTMAQQMFQEYRAVYQDKAAARAAVHATVYDAMASKLAAMAAKLQGTEARTNALQQRDQLLIQSNAAKQEAAQIAAGRMQVSTTTQRQSGGQEAPFSPDFGKYATQAKNYNANLANGGGEPDEKDKAAYSVASEKAAPWLAVLRQVDRVRDLAGKTNWAERASGRGSNAANDFATYGNTLNSAYLQAITGAAFSPEQAKDAKALIEGGTFDGSEKSQRRLDALKNFVLSQVQGQVGTLHPRLQQQYRDRLKVGGVPMNLINEIGVGQTANTKDAGAALGLHD